MLLVLSGDDDEHNYVTEAIWVCGEILYGIDHFTDTAAILNLSNLWSIIGCPGYTRSVFSCAFGQKENFKVYFSGFSIDF